MYRISEDLVVPHIPEVLAAEVLAQGSLDPEDHRSPGLLPVARRMTGSWAVEGAT